MLLLELSRFVRLSKTCSLFQDFPFLENFKIKFQDFPGFAGPVQTLIENLSKKYVLTFKCLPSNLAASNGRHIISNKYACPENKTRWIKNLSILDKLFNSVMIPFWLRTGKWFLHVTTQSHSWEKSLSVITFSLRIKPDES